MPASTDIPACTPNLRAALNPATAKPPAECPHCGCKRVTRKGIRKKKLERVQLWQCGRCRRVATPAPAHVRNTTYPPRLILDAKNILMLSRWITAYKPFTSYAGLRARGLALFPARKTLMRVKLYHRQVYEFAYHRPKLALLTGSGDRADANSAPANSASDTLTSNASTSIPGDDALHARSRCQPRFAPLASFLERVPSQCPHALFRASARASQAASPFIADNKRIAIPKENTATRTAAFVLPTTGNNHARHAALQRFMLANDSTTIAVEVPIWLHADDIAAIERRWNIELFPKAATGPSDGEPPLDHRPHRLPANPERRDPHSRLQARREHREAVRPAHPLCARPLALDRHPAVRFQVRVVQRAPVLRVLPAHGPRPQKRSLSAVTYAPTMRLNH